MANKKEVHFFDNESFFVDGSPDYSRYHAFFSPKASHKLVGEATPIYMYWHDAPRRIWEYNPDMKLVVLLRNPIDRAFSHWNMEKSRNKDSMPFWDALQSEELRCMEALPCQHRVYSYVDRGFYLEQLRRLWRYFSRENVLVLKQEYLRDQPSGCLRDVFNFLGVDHFESVRPTEVHSRPYSSNMNKKEKEYLQSVFEYEIKGLERVLGWECSNWLSQ